MSASSPGQGGRSSDPLALSLRLPCGAVLPNRLCKAAMTEGVADTRLRATDRHASMYRTWSQGGAGLLLTGNVQVDRDTRTLVGEPVIISRGFVFMRDAQGLIDGAESRIEQVLTSNGSTSLRALERSVQDALERYFYAQTKRRPMVFVFVNEV